MGFSKVLDKSFLDFRLNFWISFLPRVWMILGVGYTPFLRRFRLILSVFGEKVSVGVGRLVEASMAELNCEELNRSRRG